MSIESFEQQTGEHQQTLMARAKEWLRDTPEHDDRGMLLLAASRLSRHPIRYGALISGVAAAVLTAGVSIEGDVDLNKADTEASVNEIVWDPEQAITPATVYFDLTLVAEDIRYNMVVKACAPLLGCSDIYVDKLDPRVNKQLDGIAQEVLKIPFDAITQTTNPETGTSDLEVDMSKIEGQISWSGAGPRVRNFTISGGERNFDDQAGFRDAIAQAQASAQRLVNIDKFANTYVTLDSDSGHDMSLKGLNVLAGCNKEPEFIDEFKQQAEPAIRANALANNPDKEIGTVTFTYSKAGFVIDTGKKAEKVVGKTYGESEYLLGEDFKVDKIDCNTDSQRVVEE